MSESFSLYEYFSHIFVMKFIKLNGFFPVAGAVAFYKIKLKKKEIKFILAIKKCIH